MIFKLSRLSLIYSNPDIISGLTFPKNSDGLKLFAFVSSERFSFFHFMIPPSNIKTF